MLWRACQTESMWLDASPEKRIMVLKGGRPGLHIWSSTVSDGEPVWSHDSNIGAIHNALVEDSTLHFGAAFVNSTVNALQNHAALPGTSAAHLGRCTARPLSRSRSRPLDESPSRARAAWCSQQRGVVIARTVSRFESHPFAAPL